MIRDDAAACVNLEVWTSASSCCGFKTNEVKCYKIENIRRRKSLICSLPQLYLLEIKLLGLCTYLHCSDQLTSASRSRRSVLRLARATLKGIISLSLKSMGLMKLGLWIWPQAQREGWNPTYRHAKQAIKHIKWVDINPFTLCICPSTYKYRLFKVFSRNIIL